MNIYFERDILEQLMHAPHWSVLTYANGVYLTHT